MNNIPLNIDGTVPKMETHNLNSIGVAYSLNEGTVPNSNRGINMEMKIRHCSYCGGFIFGKKERTRYCSKSCNDKDWKLMNKDKIKSWTLSNLDKLRASNNRWKLANPKKTKAAIERWRLANKDRVNMKRREYRKLPISRHKCIIRSWTRYQIRKGLFVINHCYYPGCNTTDNLQIHHFKYIKSLAPDVIGVYCAKHHIKMDRLKS